MHVPWTCTLPEGGWTRWRRLVVGHLQAAGVAHANVGAWSIPPGGSHRLRIDVKAPCPPAGGQRFAKDRARAAAGVEQYVAGPAGEEDHGPSDRRPQGTLALDDTAVMLAHPSVGEAKPATTAPGIILTHTSSWAGSSTPTWADPADRRSSAAELGRRTNAPADLAITRNVMRQPADGPLGPPTGRGPAPVPEPTRVQ